MLTAATRQILEQSSERTFVAHVIRVPLDDVSGTHVYYLGVTLEDGTPLGLVTAATAQILRQWKRFSAIEEFLAIVPERLISITLYPSTCPEPAVIDMLIKQYRLRYKVSKVPTLESERLRLLAALQSTQGENGTTRDTSDA